MSLISFLLKIVGNKDGRQFLHSERVTLPKTQEMVAKKKCVLKRGLPEAVISCIHFSNSRFHAGFTKRTNFTPV